MNPDPKQFHFLWKREVSLPYGWAALRGGFEWFKKDLGEEVLLHGEAYQGLTAGYISGNVVERYDQKIASDLAAGATYFEEQIQELHTKGQELVDFSQNLPPQPAELSYSELLGCYQKFFDLLEIYALPLFRLFYLNEAVSQVFEKTFLHKYPSRKDYEKLSRPNGRAGIYQLADFFRKESDHDRRLSFFKKKYRWLTVIDPFWPLLSEETLDDFVRSFQVREEPGVFDPGPLSSEEKRLLVLYQDLLYAKDRRDDYRRIAFTNIRPIIEEVARRLSLTVMELSLLFVSETLHFNEKKKNLLEEIVNRNKGYILKCRGIEENILSGEGVREKFFESQNVAATDQVTGTPGSSGTVQGRAQIILSTKGVPEFKPGNILVSITTNPTFVPAMQKAKAFVTDEGGVTCHAAILAREFGKPAVVGTKIATKVFRDGDLIEVNGEKGTVRKID